jgi:hypothetical protein
MRDPGRSWRRFVSAQRIVGAGLHLVGLEIP